MRTDRRTRILSAPAETSGTAKSKPPQIAISVNGDKPASWVEQVTGTAPCNSLCPFTNFLKS